MIMLTYMNQTTQMTDPLLSPFYVNSEREILIMITAKLLTAALGAAPHDADEYAAPLNEAMDEFEIDTKKRQAMFLAQCAHESGQFRTVVENLNYSADGLQRTFPRHFRTASVRNYHRQPEKIANRVYSNRMGNGDEASGDGWRFRGRGLIQLTGKSNYILCSADLEVDLLENPNYLVTPEGAARSAAWFWWKNDLNDLADIGDIVGSTRRINGGVNGLEHRKQLYRSAMKVFPG
jgi:putative chitinase